MNSWSPQQLSSLIQISSQYRLYSSAIEIDNILRCATINIQSRLFRSLATVLQNARRTGLAGAPTFALN